MTNIVPWCGEGLMGRFLAPLNAPVQGPLVITLITPNLNGARYLEQCLASVARQGYGPLQHIVADGGSTDGSLEILGGHPNVEVLAGPDLGSHDALNKALGRAWGDVVGFLNTDDILGGGTLAAVARYFAANPECQAVRVQALMFETSENGEESIVARFVHLDDPQGRWDQLLYGTPAFNSWFFRRAALSALSGFDLRYDYSADRDLLLRLMLGGVEPSTINDGAYLYRRHDGSRTVNPQNRTAALFLAEHREMAERLAQAWKGGERSRRLRSWGCAETYLAFRLALSEGRYGAAVNALTVLMQYGPALLPHLLAARHRRRALSKAAGGVAGGLSAQ